MPHGTPDWGLVGPLPTFFGLDDLGEHAVRVGAVSSWERIGHVVFSDNFSEGLGAWHRELSSVDGTAGLFTEEALSPPYCARLVNGSGGTFYARLTHHLGYAYRGRVGLECNIAFTEDTEYIEFRLFSSLPTGRTFSGVRLTPATGALEHGRGPLDWTNFETLGALTPNLWQWHNVKLVVDFDTGLFVRFIWEGVPIDMAAIAAVTIAAGTVWEWNAFVEVTSSDSEQYELRLDDVILTVDEP